MLPNPKDPAYLGALIYFHHVAKAMSFTKAADALSVTPSAVSHRVSALEAALGRRLFEREVRKIHLTQDGLELAKSTEAIWEHLQRITTQLTRQHVLRVSVGPYLSSQWLMPRLPHFEEQYPHVRVDLIHRIGEPSANLADVSIVWSDLSKDDTSALRLFDTQTIPVAARGSDLEDPFWTGHMPPIHYRDRAAWREWLVAAGGPAEFADRGEVLDDPNIVLESAAYGRGIAMGFLPFISAYIDAGRLARVAKRAFRSSCGYRLILNKPDNSIATTFANWVSIQSNQTGRTRQTSS